MADIDATVAEVAAATDWNARVSLIRKVPEAFGTALHRDVYARIARRVYVPNLAPDFAYVHWRAEYELQSIEDAYGSAYERTEGFTVTDVETLTTTISASGSDTLRALLECKVANDGGTARDKAARYGTLRAEASRLGGIPLFAVLAGLGWRRTADALGPVVRDTDGRVFTLPTLQDILEVQPFPGLTMV